MMNNFAPFLLQNSSSVDLLNLGAPQGGAEVEPAAATGNSLLVDVFESNASPASPAEPEVAEINLSK